MGLRVNMTKFCNKIIINELSSKFQIIIEGHDLRGLPQQRRKLVSYPCLCSWVSPSVHLPHWKKDSIDLGFLGRRDQMNQSHPFHIYVLLMFLCLLQAEIIMQLLLKSAMIKGPLKFILVRFQSHIFWNSMHRSLAHFKERHLYHVFHNMVEGASVGIGRRRNAFGQSDRPLRAHAHACTHLCSLWSSPR